jgi:putative ABC transport system ATP-binding protein
MIRTIDIHKTYRTNNIEFQALRGVDLEFNEGEFSVLAGPSGSGKTTLLNIISTLDSPTSGEVYIDDQEVSTLDDQQRTELRLRKVGFVFQAYNLINVLSAAENVEYVLQLQGQSFKERRQRSMQLLRQVGMEGLENRRPDELSGGQQQRIAVARALATEPKIVIADEPTANLDQQTGKGLIDLMLQLNDDLGITFIISSHDQMVINRGRRVVSLLDGVIQKDSHKSV